MSHCIKVESATELIKTWEKRREMQKGGRPICLLQVGGYLFHFHYIQNYLYSNLLRVEKFSVKGRNEGVIIECGAIAPLFC